MENERIFRERIVPDLLEGRASQETPTVVFLVGQPGAGKSRVTELVAAQLNRHGGFVDADSDLYKPYHPAYAARMAQDDTLMAAYTRADGRAWMAQAEQDVRDHGLPHHPGDLPERRGRAGQHARLGSFVWISRSLVRVCR
ncbi:zeta toxin family protein [Streptomyces rochei]|uniref:zeta toxin family protein n=1 Tax=Streptomyces rochei TaxID=1928 RepID=UPI0033AE1991